MLLEGIECDDGHDDDDDDDDGDDDDDDDEQDDYDRKHKNDQQICKFSKKIKQKCGISNHVRDPLSCHHFASDRRQNYDP